MAVINTGLVEAGLKSEFFARYDEIPGAYQRLATRVVSTKDGEKYNFLGTVPQMREWGNGRLARGLRSESYSVENQKYETTIEVDRDEIDDDQTGQIRIRVAEMAHRAATHKDRLISELLINGESAGYHSYDGVPFISDAHVSGDSGAQSNKLTYDAAAPDAPTVSEFRAALAQAMAAMMAFKDDQGEPMVVRSTDFIIVTAPQLHFTAREVVSATLFENTNNTFKMAADPIVLPWLTDASKWYLCHVGAPIRPFVFQDRMPIEFGAQEEDSSEGFKNERFLYGVRARYAMAYGYWQYCVRTDFI